MTTFKKHWSHGIQGENISNTFENMKDQIITLSRKGKHDESEKKFDEFLNDYKIVIPDLVEERTQYYLINNVAYDYWTDIIDSIKQTRHELEKELEKIYINW